MGLLPVLLLVLRSEGLVVSLRVGFGLSFWRWRFGGFGEGHVLLFSVEEVFVECGGELLCCSV